MRCSKAALWSSRQRQRTSSSARSCAGVGMSWYLKVLRRLIAAIVVGSLSQVYAFGLGHDAQSEANRIAVAGDAVPVSNGGNGRAVRIIQPNGGELPHTESIPQRYTSCKG